MARSRAPRTIAALLADIQARPTVYFPALGKGGAGRTAQAATYLNYGPQFDALSALLGTARSDRRSTVISSRRAGQAGSQAIQGIRDSYATGLKDTLGSLGGPVAAGTPVTSPEQRAAQHLGLSGTALSGMLSGMAAQQVAGANNQAAMARREFGSARNDIAGKLTSLLGQAGAYNTQQYETLTGEQRKAAAAQKQALASQRIQLMTAGINPDTGTYDPSLDKPVAPTINQYGVDSVTWASMTKEQRQQAAKEWKNSTSTDKGPSSADRRERVEQYREVRDDITRVKSYYSSLVGKKIYRDPEDPKNVSETPQDGFEEIVVSPSAAWRSTQKKYGDKVPPVILNAGRQLADDGLTEGMLRRLRRRYPKIEVPKAWHYTPGFDGW